MSGTNEASEGNNGPDIINGRALRLTSADSLAESPTLRLAWFAWTRL
jgi:hypothetical protein